MSDYFAFSWEGRDYSVALADITAAEFRAIKQHTGIRAGEFVAALTSPGNMDGDAVMALLWLGQRHAGIPNPPFRDDLPVFQFLVELGEKAAALDAAALVDGAADAGPKA